MIDGSLQLTSGRFATLGGRSEVNNAHLKVR
jgi:hypothetical protein